MGRRGAPGRPPLSGLLGHTLCRHRGTDSPGTAALAGSALVPGTGLTSLLPRAPCASTDPSLQASPGLSTALQLVTLLPDGGLATPLEAAEACWSRSGARGPDPPLLPQVWQPAQPPCPWGGHTSPSLFQETCRLCAHSRVSPWRQPWVVSCRTKRSGRW